MIKRIVLLFLVLAVAGCAAPVAAPSGQVGPDGAPTGPQRITVASLNAGAVVSGDVNVIELFTAGLVNFSPDGYPAAQLAESVPTVENGLWKIFAERAPPGN